MPTPQPRYSKEEFARRGDEIYEHDILPHLQASDEGKFVVIDIETGAYEIDADELAASDRLLAHHPEAQMWMRRVGSRYARRFGSRDRSIALGKRGHSTFSWAKRGLSSVPGIWRSGLTQHSSRSRTAPAEFQCYTSFEVT